MSFSISRAVIPPSAVTKRIFPRFCGSASDIRYREHITMVVPTEGNFCIWPPALPRWPALSRVALAQAYPTRPVRIIVGFPPGFLADIAPRLIAQSLSDSLRQQFVVENRPGASSNIATDAVVRAPPDGYSLLLVTQTNATNATLYENLSFNFIRDIAPVACIGTYPFVMVVRPSVPAKTVPEFMDYAKANPAKVNMSSPGTGSAGHIFGELFKIMTGVHIVHVPYRASFIPDLLSG
jgi:tripartite-type tricarboxylate transporter receptor subunit TctC